MNKRQKKKHERDYPSWIKICKTCGTQTYKNEDGIFNECWYCELFLEENHKKEDSK